MKTLIKNAKIITSTAVLKGQYLTFTDGVIDYIGTEEVAADEVIDAAGGYLVPGFIDIHCHGGDGLEFMDASVEEIGKIAEFHKSHGTTTLFATTLAADDGETREALDTYTKYRESHPNSTIYGIHLEGPWLNPAQCGAQNTSYMKLPNAEELRELKEKYPFIYKVGAAPEREGGAEFGEMGKKLGIVMSPAHTDGTFSDMEEALKSGKVKRYITDFPNDRTASMEGVVAIPHLGASTQESEDNCAKMAVRQLMNFIENGNIVNSVNFPNCDLGICTKASRVTILHRNIPNSLSQFTSALAAEGINISDLMNRSKGEYAYTMLDLDHVPSENVIEALKKIDGVLRVRVVR